MEQKDVPYIVFESSEGDIIMTNLKNPSWWNFATTRAIKTFAQTFIATVGTSAIIDDVNWQIVLSASLLSMLLSYMTSLAGLPEVTYEGYDNELD